MWALRHAEVPQLIWNIKLQTCDRCQVAQILCLSKGCVDIFMGCKYYGPLHLYEKTMPHGDEIEYFIGSATQDG